MEALTNALATLVALEARFTELVNPVEAIAEAVKSVVKEAAIVVEDLHGRVSGLEQLEARVAALEEHMVAVTNAPAIQSDVKPFPVEVGSVVIEPIESAPVAGPDAVAEQKPEAVAERSGT